MAGTATIVIDRLSVAVTPRLSTTSIVNVVGPPDAVGVPVMAPDVLNDKPSGNAPDSTDQV